MKKRQNEINDKKHSRESMTSRFLLSCVENSSGDRFPITSAVYDRVYFKVKYSIFNFLKILKDKR